MGSVGPPAKAALVAVKTTSADAIAVLMKVAILMVSPSKEKSNARHGGA
jgi:hypothetical protein